VAAGTHEDDTMNHTNIEVAGPSPSLMSAGSISSNKIVNPSGDILGDVKEIMLDMHTGRVSYVVLSFGGFLSLGEKLFAVPWNALKLDTVNKTFVLDIPKERLEAAPGFDKDDWPNMGDATWAHGIHAYYGTQPDTVELRRN
jgi:sporulation protein YlmC with PRC-barrel domain